MKRRPRAILFDDEPDLVRLLELLLKREGYEVFTYTDPSLCPLQQSHGCQCGEMQLCADLMITDIDMPNVSGLDFIEGQIRKGCKIQKIAIVSGGWSEAKKKRAEDLGCAVFEKPVALSALTDWIKQCGERTDQDKDLANWFL
ncbi:MAG: response regulator [Verrucomicrobia bacterium]|nr:response regulator [Verrucomicrobiota bacterium]MBT7700661.1 response regulator [Verrucomicrobiota bacterium]